MLAYNKSYDDDYDIRKKYFTRYNIIYMYKARSYNMILFVMLVYRCIQTFPDGKVISTVHIILYVIYTEKISGEHAKKYISTTER